MKLFHLRCQILFAPAKYYTVVNSNQQLAKEKKFKKPQIIQLLNAISRAV